MQDLLAALRFPAQLHERSPDPGPFFDHRSYKSHLRSEFRSKCIYCRIPDGLGGYEGFGVDHYLPKAQFPDLALAWSNLFYACNTCNAWKGSFVSTQVSFLPNPCDHCMADHLQYEETEIETYTTHGQQLAELLHLSERRGHREMLLSAVRLGLRARKQLLLDLIDLETKREEVRHREEDELQALETAIRRTLQELGRVELHLERLTGESLQTAAHADR